MPFHRFENFKVHHLNPHLSTGEGPVMIWSCGPDRSADTTKPAKVGTNKDNILSWQQ